jgi:hypothetical protein
MGDGDDRADKTDRRCFHRGAHGFAGVMTAAGRAADDAPVATGAGAVNAGADGVLSAGADGADT